MIEFSIFWFLSTIISLVCLFGVTQNLIRLLEEGKKSVKSDFATILVLYRQAKSSHESCRKYFVD